MSSGHTVGLASRTFPHGARALHTLVEAPGTVALLTGPDEWVRGRLPIDMAEEVLRDAFAEDPRPGLDALAALVRAAHHAVDAWATPSDRRELLYWGASVAIVVVDGPTARIAQLGDMTTSLARSGLLLTIGHEHTFEQRARWPEGWKVPDGLGGVVLQALGAMSVPWVSFAQVDLAPGNRLVITSRHATSGMQTLARSALAAPAAVLAEMIVAAGEAQFDRSCVVIEIDALASGPYR